MTVKEMGRRVKVRRPFYFSQWSHFFVQISQGEGQRPSRRSRFAAIAARAVTEAKAAGRQLAKDVLSDFTEIFKSMAVQYLPLAGNENASR
jgi:hypothetical protein